MQKQCLNCSFWEEHTEDLGKCRRLPPTTINMEEPERFGIWPTTFYSAWCGEFKKREPNQLEEENGSRS